MGFSVSWIALPPSHIDAALPTLGFTLEEQFSASEDWRYNLGHLSESWALILATRCDFAPSAPLAAISRNTAIYAFYAEEHVMVSGISAWQAGKEQWSVDHDPNNGIDHLEINGTPPDIVGKARARRLNQQVNAATGITVDYIFSVATDVGEELVGYRYDKYVEQPRRFQELSRNKRWWEFWR